MTKRKHSFEELASSFDLDTKSDLSERTTVEIITQAPVEIVAGIPAIDAIVERPGSFDYDQLDVEGRQFLLERQRRIVRIIGTAVIKTGLELRLAKAFIKENCEKGSWTKWLQTALDFGEQTGRNYINASVWAETSPTVGVLSPTAIYEGASAPAEVKTEILRMIDAGNIPPATKIKEMVKEYKAEIANASVQDQSEVLDSEISLKIVASPNYSPEDPVLTLEVDEPLGNPDDLFGGPIKEDRGQTGVNAAQGKSAWMTARVRSSDMHKDIDHDTGDIIDVVDRYASELVARLREAFEDHIIREIVDLWSKTSPAQILGHLDNSVWSIPPEEV